MKKAVIILIFIPLFTSAQNESTDTVKSRELNEIVIEAQMQQTGAEVSTYIPLARQKNTAADAVSLLSQMAIPQLDVDPTNNSVKTTGGQTVSIFIDYIAATAQDLSGMRTTDVKKVEYLLYPKDPRFHGAQHVLNFVMQKYEWGGYTKINANKWFGVNRSEASVYSKFAYKSMIFDIFSNDIYLTNRHTGSASIETFCFPNLNGQSAQTVQRITTPVSSQYRNNSNDVTFRALYSSEKLQVSNMLSFNNTSIPHNNSEILIEYANGFAPSSLSKSISSNNSWGLNYNFETYAAINQSVAMDIEATYSYGHNKAKADYIDGEFNIVNNAKENTHNVRITPNLVWNIDKNNSLIPGIHAEYNNFSIDYSGNSPSLQHYAIWGLWGGLRYNYTQEKWTAGTMFGWTYANTDLTGTKNQDNYPTGNVYASFSPGKRHQLQFRYSFGKMVPDTYQKSPNMLQQNELMWYKGNPELKNYWINIINMAYTWLPSNKWQFEADGQFYSQNKRIVTQYRPTAPNGTMLRQYVNNYTFNGGSIGLNGTAKFSGGRLIAKIRPEIGFTKTSGEYNLSLNEITCTAQLTWYFGDFYLFGWYMTPKTYIGEESGCKERLPSRYQIQLGYGKGAWRASATAFNFLNSNWKTKHQTLTSQYYSYERGEFGTSQHMRFQFSVTYTIGYGKKVKQNNEVVGSGTIESAILK